MYRFVNRSISVQPLSGHATIFLYRLPRRRGQKLRALPVRRSHLLFAKAPIQRPPFIWNRRWSGLNSQRFGRTIRRSLRVVLRFFRISGKRRANETVGRAVVKPLNFHSLGTGSVQVISQTNKLFCQ